MVRVCVRVCACVYVNIERERGSSFERSRIHSFSDLGSTRPPFHSCRKAQLQLGTLIPLWHSHWSQQWCGVFFGWGNLWWSVRMNVCNGRRPNNPPKKKCSLAWDVAMLQFLEENLEYWSSFFRKLFLQEWRHPVRWQNPFPNYLIQPTRKSNLFWWTMDKKSGES